MGVLIILKQPVFKQGNKISHEPIYPLQLKELTIVNSTYYGVVSNK